MSISIDGANSQVNFSQVLQKGDGMQAGGVAGKEAAAILSGDGLTVSERASAAAASGTGTVARTERNEKTQETIQTLLENAEQIDSLVDDLTALAEQLGAVVPPQGTPVPKADLESVQALVNAFNSEFGTSIGPGVASALATASSSGTASASAATASAGSTAVEKNSSDGGVKASSKYAEPDAMFSIYQMISLLQDVGRQERSAARELRQAELTCELASIDLQTSMQRDAAMWGMIASVVTCSMQIAMTVTSVSLATAGTKTPENTSAAQDVAQNNKSVDTLEAGRSGKAAENTKAIEMETSDANKAAVEERWNACGCNEAKAKYDEACKGLDTKKIASLQGQKAEIDRKLGEVQGIDRSGMGKAELEACDDTEKNLKTQSAAKSAEIKELQKPAEPARKEYLASIDKAMGEQQADYDSKSALTKEAEGKTIDNKKTASHSENRRYVKDQKAAQGAQKDAGEQRALMEAKAMEARCSLGEIPTERDVTAANAKFGESQANLKYDRGYKAAQKEVKDHSVTAGFLQQMTNVVGSLGQAISTGVSQTMQSEATAESATQKQMEADREMTNDLFRQAGDLLSAARQLLQSVIQAESSAIEQIIRA